MMKNILKTALTVLFLSFASAGYPALSPEEIVSKADEIRSPQIDYTVDATVTSVRPNGEKRVAKYEILVKGRDKAIIKTLYPDMDRGRTLLMLGRDMWVFLPDVSKPVRISLQQRLLGEVANGDIARTNFSGDYDPKLLRTETIDGKKYYVLDLTAKSEEVTYGKAVYWVGTDNLYPYKAEFYALSGRLLKLCAYEDFRNLGGRRRPARLVLKDPLVKGQISTIDYSNMKTVELPEKYFTKDYLKKLKY